MRRSISLAVGGHEVHAALHALGHNLGKKGGREEGGRDGGNEEKKEINFDTGDLSKQFDTGAFL